MARYTAEEMRDVALTLEAFRMFKDPDYIDDYLTKAQSMLRQAADMMEREEKREKKYEFSVYPPEINGVFQYRAGAELNAFMLKQNGDRDGTIVRREVGEWEEVK